MFEPKTLSSKEMRANRVSRLRKATGKSRQNFSHDHKLSAGTLQNWEAARYGGLSEKGAKALIEAFAANGIHCSFEWLMYGVGDEPLLEINHPSTNHHLTRTQPLRIDDELAFFYQQHNEAVHLSITDESMMPFFKPKQIIAGIKQFGRSINQLCNGHVCIVQLHHCKTQLLRLVQIDESSATHVKLIQLNNLTPSKTSLDTLYLIDFAAPITWIREENI